MQFAQFAQFLLVADTCKYSCGSCEDTGSGLLLRVLSARVMSQAIYIYFIRSPLTLHQAFPLMLSISLNGSAHYTDKMCDGCEELL